MTNWLQILPVAAGVSAVVTIALRWLDRPRAVLRVEARMTSGPYLTSSAGRVTAFASLINIGDGNAYDVRLYGSGCDVAVPSRDDLQPGTTQMWAHRLAILGAGQTARLTVGVPEALSGSEALVVTWSPSPKRWLRKTKRFEFNELPTESIFPPSIMDAVDIPKHVRRTKKLEELSPRANHTLKRDENNDGSEER